MIKCLFYFEYFAEEKVLNKFLIRQASQMSIIKHTRYHNNQDRKILFPLFNMGCLLPVSKYTHIFRNNSTGDSRNAQKQTFVASLSL